MKCPARALSGDNRRGVERAGWYHAAMNEQPRPDASTDEHSFLLSVEEAADRYAAAGHPRTIRAIQKYCGRGDLESQKVETTFGHRYLITPESIDRHIAQIIERSQTNGREQPRPAASVRSTETRANTSDEQSAADREQPRPAAVDDRYVQLLERDNEFLRGQVSTKDDQIKQANVLTQGLQRLIASLTGNPDPAAEPESAGKIAVVSHTASAEGPVGHQ
jgi:hypothetical protein